MLSGAPRVDQRSILGDCYTRAASIHSGLGTVQVDVVLTLWPLTQSSQSSSYTPWPWISSGKCCPYTMPPNSHPKADSLHRSLGTVQVNVVHTLWPPTSHLEAVSLHRDLGTVQVNVVRTLWPPTSHLGAVSLHWGLGTVQVDVVLTL